MNLKLVKLSEQYRPQLTDMMQEWLAAEQDFSPYAIRKNDYRDFGCYLEQLECKEERNGRVPDSVYFCLDQDRNIFVGAVNIRHYLNENLCHTGGHIGDGIRPSERRKGCATAMIGLALEKCRELGINKVLMTCDRDNIGSAKSIMNNGGVLDYEVIEDGVPEQRYWITLKEETVETERLILKREMPADYREAFAWESDARVCKYLPERPCERAEELLPRLERQDPNSVVRYAMLLHSRVDNRAVGEVQMFLDGDIWRFDCKIRFDDWGRGYATEAVRAMIDYVKCTRGARVIEAQCAAENLGGVRVMEKLGMTCVGVGRYEDESDAFVSPVFRLEL